MNRTIHSARIFLLPCIWAIATGAQSANLDHGQGEMAGRVKSDSVILQSRLTQGDTLIDGDLPGSPGTARFEISTSANFADSFSTDWIEAKEESDFIVKTFVDGLDPATQYYYRLVYGPNQESTALGRTCEFRTLGGAGESREVKFAIVTGMNYFFFHEGEYDPETAYRGEDKHLGYPALASILKLEPDYFVGTGDNVYFDHPALRANSDRYMGEAWKGSAKTEKQMRRKYHEQFIQPRFVDLFAKVPVYWEVDDHDYRYNDCDNSGDRIPTPEMGRRNFQEQMPVVDPNDPDPLTYGTYRITKHLQIWLLEGRYYRSPNRMPDGPDKTIWGARQKQWLKETLLASQATFKIMISPTPLVGPDGAGKIDSHVNLGGFRHEGDEFFAWLTDNGFLEKNFYILCGDRHWQYHAVHPSGFEEYSCGALVEANSRFGVRAGDPNSTDPEGEIDQIYCKLEGEPSAGFLIMSVTPDSSGAKASATFSFYDEHGVLVYSDTKESK